MNDVIQKEVNFSGIVEEVYQGSILVRINEGEEELQSSDLIIISLKLFLLQKMVFQCSQQ